MDRLRRSRKCRKDNEATRYGNTEDWRSISRHDFTSEAGRQVRTDNRIEFEGQFKFIGRDEA